MPASGDSSTARSTSGAGVEPAPADSSRLDGPCSSAESISSDAVSTSDVISPIASPDVPGDAALAIDGSLCMNCPRRRRGCPQLQRPERPRSSKEPPHYTLGEEIANSITHGIGVLLAIAGLVLLIVKAALGGAESTHIASAIVFGVTLILEYLASTLYHAIAVPAAKRIFRTIDHSCIYLLIAGSYTPFCLITLANDGGIVLFVLVWALAFAGISFEIVGRQRQPRWVTILIYLVMGWLVVFRLPQLIAALDPVALALLTVGGICYTIGTAFYLMKKIRYMHSVWHLWVLAGSVFMFMAVILYVI